MEVNDRAVRIKAAFSAAIAFGTALFGWVGWVIVIWICAMVLDYLTGSFAAIYMGKWTSRKASQGLWHKLGSITYPTTGWYKFDGDYFYYENGEYVINTTRTINGVTYTFGSDGVSDKTPSFNIWFFPSFMIRMCTCKPDPALPAVILGAKVTLYPYLYPRLRITHLAIIN